MKYLLNVILAVVAFATVAVSAKGQTVMFTGVGSPTFVRHELDPYPAKTAFFLSTFKLQVTAGNEDVVLPIFPFADTDTNGYLGFLTGIIYQNGIIFDTRDFASFNVLAGSNSTDSLGRFLVNAHQMVIFEATFNFGVSDPVVHDYGIMIESFGYGLGDGSPIDQIAPLTGPEWSAGVTTAIPEPWVTAVCLGLAAFGPTYYLKRRKPVQTA